MKKSGNTHEAYEAKKQTKMGSEKSFGLVFAAFFGLIAFFTLNIVYVGISVVFLGIALFYPKALKPLNYVWFKFGLLLHFIVSPIIMFAVYVLAIIPTGLFVRLAKKDLLKTSYEPEAETYWIKTSDEENKNFNFKTQF